MHAYAKFAIAIVAAGLTVLTGTPAQAGGNATETVDVLTVSSLGGPNVAVGDVLSASLKSGTNVTFMSQPGGTTGVTCTASTFSATVLTNPPAGGTATETLTSQTFGGTCTANVPGVLAVQSIAVNNLPYGAAVNGTTKVVTISGGANLIQTTVKLSTFLGTITCVYRADLNQVVGTASNADNSIKFTDQKFNKFSGPSTCFANGYFSATYAPVVDTSVAGSPSVFTQ